MGSLRVVDFCSCSQLKDLIGKNLEDFQTDESQGGRNLYLSLKKLQRNLEDVVPVATDVDHLAGQYDFDGTTKGNGYRSYVRIFKSAVQKSIEECKTIDRKKKSFFFSTYSHAKTIESWSQVFSSLKTIFEVLLNIDSNSKNGCLAPMNSEDIIASVDARTRVDNRPFYGQVFGFQYIPSFQSLMGMWSILQAVWSVLFYNVKSFRDWVPSFLRCIRYIIHKEDRGRRVAVLSLEGTIDFFKNFLTIADSRIVMMVQSFASRHIPVNRDILVPPHNIEVPGQDGRKVTVTPPSSHLGFRSVLCRLSSLRIRTGMEEEKTGQAVSDLSSSLVINFHGGGFVATSSKNQDLYLMDWATQLDVPIFSVEYTLAPDAQFPRQLEECFFAYCWALANAKLLGSTAENVCLIGESAGGNLALGVALKCIEHGIRPPSGLYLLFTPCFLEVTLLPSRLLCLMDSIIPVGFLTECLEAYLGNAGPKVPDQLKTVVKTDPLEVDSLLLHSSTSSKEECHKNDEKEPPRVGALLHRIACLFSLFFTTYFPTSRSEENGLLPKHLREEERLAPRGEMGKNGNYNKLNRHFCHSSSFEIDTETSSPMKVISSEQEVKVFHDCSVSPDPYLSPYYASKEMMGQLPPVHLLSTDLDPCLDDNVELAKKLRDAGVDTSLEVLEGMPHACLLFLMASKDAKKASDKAVKKLKAILKIHK